MTNNKQVEYVLAYSLEDANLLAGRVLLGVTPPMALDLRDALELWGRHPLPERARLGVYRAEGKRSPTGLKMDLRKMDVEAIVCSTAVINALES